MRIPQPDPIRILLVEDDEDDYTIVCDRLSGLFASGSSLAWVRDYDEALEALSSGLFDVCLLDYQLGERSGMELLEEATRQGSTTPILFLTGTGNYEIDFTAMKMGAADYLTKDQLSATLLERAIRYAIEIRRKNEELLLSRLSAERREAELALRESEVRYKLIMEATNDGLWDWDIKTGEVLRNPVYFAMLGYEEKELESDVGKWPGLIHPDDIDGVSRVLRQYLAGKIKTYDIEYRMVHKSGSAVWVHSRGKAVAFDEEGNPARMVGTIADITERKRVEQELRESEQRYRELFEAGSDAILFIEADTERILEANNTAATMFGYSREELLAKKNWELSEEPEETRRKTRGASLVPGQVITVPLRYLRRKDGTVFPTEITGRSFF
ncbi:MAG: PAS domain S-box protein, partial [Syntrophobacteraceae bacterium]